MDWESCKLISLTPVIEKYSSPGNIEMIKHILRYDNLLKIIIERNVEKWMRRGRPRAQIMKDMKMVNYQGKRKNIKL